MDLKKVMIIINGEIVTKNIQYYKWEDRSNFYTIKFKGKDTLYTYNYNKVRIIREVKNLSAKKFLFYIDGKLLCNVRDVFEFDDNGTYYYHIVFSDDSFKDYKGYDLKKVNNDCGNVLDYFRAVSEKTALETGEGPAKLCKYMSGVNVDCLDSALALYLKLSKNNSNKSLDGCLIFPFGCNSSQYEAVDKAINNKISAIEGPPGTGKTQTILNIIANILIRDMTCQVVSNNNIAIMNIEEKLKKYDLDFFDAMLGRRKNKNDFLDKQKSNIPFFADIDELAIDELASSVLNESMIVRKMYDAKNELARLIQKKNDLSLEYEYFKRLMKEKGVSLVPLTRFKIGKLKLLWNELMSINKLSFFKKVKYIFIDGVGNFNFFNRNISLILDSVQDEIYQFDLNQVDKDIYEINQFIESNKEREKIFVDSSMKYFKKYLSLKYKDGKNIYTSKNMWSNCEKFLKDYPVVLSTTYSSKNNIPSNIKFDYVIMDESSQVDVVTGTLALSSAKYAVIIGDEKQLSHVVDNKKRKSIDAIFDNFAIDKGYSYVLNNFLVSVKRIIPDIPITMLKEHYRCHPKIINFCNKKFYNNELIIMSEDNGENDAIKVIKTVEGDHARNTNNQRQVDVIEELLGSISMEEIGIMAPYNDQVNLIKTCLSKEILKRKIEVLTVHKYQGKEKNVIIYSTVDNDIGDFVADSNLFNVAISRAKKQFILIVTGKDISNRNIRDFIDYVDYNNMEISSSKIYSVFDMLYKQYEIERLNFYKIHNKVSKFDSENFIYYLIEDILKDYSYLSFIFSQPLRSLIVDTSLLNEQEKKYASNYKTHIDFYIFNNITKKPVLAVEVDGYKYHKEGTEQYERDKLKNSILKKYEIPLVRLKTNGSEEEQIIRKMLDKMLIGGV